MAKLRVTFEVDTASLAGRLWELDGDISGLAARLIAVLATGILSSADTAGLATYGIALEGVTTLKQPITIDAIPAAVPPQA